MPAERSTRPKKRAIVWIDAPADTSSIAPREVPLRPVRSTRKAAAKHEEDYAPSNLDDVDVSDPKGKGKAKGKRKTGGSSEPVGKFGEVEGYPVGSTFKSREECMKAGVHAVGVAGIHGSKHMGAYSICVSGGYEDDIDDGEFLVYTGAGGQVDPYKARSSQVKDQSFEHDHNAALKKSSERGAQPVRVVRGENRDSKWAPLAGLRYDGLYRVEKAVLEKGLSGRKICSFHLRRLPGQPPIVTKWK